jgi:hypothetical protein
LQHCPSMSQALLNHPTAQQYSIAVSLSIYSIKNYSLAT